MGRALSTKLNNTMRTKKNQSSPERSRGKAPSIVITNIPVGKGRDTVSTKNNVENPKIAIDSVPEGWEGHCQQNSTTL